MYSIRATDLNKFQLTASFHDSIILITLFLDEDNHTTLYTLSFSQRCYHPLFNVCSGHIHMPYFGATGTPILDFGGDNFGPICILLVWNLPEVKTYYI